MRVERLWHTLYPYSHHHGNCFPTKIKGGKKLFIFFEKRKKDKGYVLSPKRWKWYDIIKRYKDVAPTWKIKNIGTISGAGPWAKPFKPLARAANILN